MSNSEFMDSLEQEKCLIEINIKTVLKKKNNNYLMETTIMSERTKRTARKEKRSGADAAKKRAEQHVGYGSIYLQKPEGLRMFTLKSDKPLRLDILAYKVGEGNP